MLENYVQHRLEEIVEENYLGEVWFQQDKTTARNLLAALRRMFPTRLGEMCCGQHSLDLNMCDFFFLRLL